VQRCIRAWTSRSHRRAWLTCVAGLLQKCLSPDARMHQEPDRDPQQCGIADWTDAFEPARSVGLAELARQEEWRYWMAHFTPGARLPCDPLEEGNPFSINGYLVPCVSLLSTVLTSVKTLASDGTTAQTFWQQERKETRAGPASIFEEITRLVKYGQIVTIAGVLAALDLLKSTFANRLATPRTLYCVSST